MGYQINTTWKKLREKDILELNKIIDDEYCNELEIGRKLNLMDKLNKVFNEELSNINFDNILDFMEVNDWKWSIYKNGKSYYEVPTKEYIIDQLKNDFLKHCMFEIIELNKTESGRESGGIVLDIGINGNDAWCRIYFDIAHYNKY